MKYQNTTKIEIAKINKEIIMKGKIKMRTVNADGSTLPFATIARSIPGTPIIIYEEDRRGIAKQKIVGMVSGESADQDGDGYINLDCIFFEKEYTGVCTPKIKLEGDEPVVMSFVQDCTQEAKECE